MGLKTGLVVALVLFVTLTATAEEEKVSFAFDGAPLAEVADFFQTLKGVKIDVADELKDAVISLSVTDMKIGAALDLMVKLANPNGRVERLSDRHYRLYLEKAKTDWKAALEKKLDRNRVNIAFEDTGITDALRFLGVYAHANIVIDPAVQDAKSQDELLVTLRADGISVKNAIELITLTKSLAYDLRWGVVFISLEDRLMSLPAGKPEFGDDPANEMILAALEKPVEVNFVSTNVVQVLNYLKAVMEVNIVIDDAILSEAEKTLVTASVLDIPLLHALQLILLPRGFPFRLQDGVIYVTRSAPPDRNAPADKVENGLPDTKTNVNFEETPIREVLRFLSQLGSVPITIDPHLARVMNEDELLVTLAAADISLSNCLQLITLTKGLASDVRWGGVFVSTADRLKELPKVVLPEAVANAPEWETKLREQLAGKITFSFDQATVTEALSFISTLRGLNIVIDPKARTLAEESPLTLTVTNLPIADALAASLLPLGLTFELKNEVVLVKLR